MTVVSMTCSNTPDDLRIKQRIKQHFHLTDNFMHQDRTFLAGTLSYWLKEHCFPGQI